MTERMWLELALHAVILLVGLVTLAPFRGRANAVAVVGAGWFVGLGVLMLAQFGCVFLGLAATIPTTLAMIVLVVSLTWALGSCLLPTVRDRLRAGTILAALARPVGVALVAMIALAAASTQVQQIKTTPDSHQYNLVAAKVVQLGPNTRVETTNHYLANYLDSVRLPMVVAAPAVAKQLGMDWNFGMYVHSAVFLGLVALGCWRDAMPRWTSVWPLVLAGFGLVTIRVFRMHLFYIHSNMLTACVFCSGVLLLARSRRRGEPFWFLAGCMILGLTPFVRKETLAFVVVPLAAVLALRPPMPRIRLTGAILFLAPGVLFTVLFLTLLDPNADINFTTTGHAGWAFRAAFLLVHAMVLALPWTFLHRLRPGRWAWVAMGSLAVAMFAVSERFRFVWESLNTLRFEIGQWQETWVYGFGVLAVAAVFLTISAWAPRRWSRRLPWPEQGRVEMRVVMVTALAYVLLQQILHVVFDNPALSGHMHSGNRMHLHLIPLVFWIGARLIVPGPRTRALLRKAADTWVGKPVRDRTASHDASAG